MDKYLIAGLGNIDPEYKGTRHNIGFDIVDAFVLRHGGFYVVEKHALVSKFNLKGKQIVCIKPTTYMNLSGKAVKYWTAKGKVELKNLLVIIDEVALPLNKIRLRPSGSDAGHNGLRSVIESLETDIFPRLRFGIGNNYPKGYQIEYVLGKWNKEEVPLVQLKISACADLLDSFIFKGIEGAMNEFNNLEFSL